MIKLSQRGIVGLEVIGVIVVAVALIGFGVYRYNDSQNSRISNDETQQFDAESTSKIEPIDEKLAQEEAKQKTEVVEEEPEPKKVTVSETKKEPVEEPAKKTDKQYIEMQKVSASQNGSLVKAVSRLPEAMSGTCHFKLYQEGYERMYSSTTISNSKDCSGQIDISDAATYDGWDLHLWFDSSDGKVFAYVPEFSFPLSNPN